MTDYYAGVLRLPLASPHGLGHSLWLMRTAGAPNPQFVCTQPRLSPCPGHSFGWIPFSLFPSCTAFGSLCPTSAGRQPDRPGPKGAYRALCARCAKSWLFSTTGSLVSSED